MKKFNYMTAGYGWQLQALTKGTQALLALAMTVLLVGCATTQSEQEEQAEKEFEFARTTFSFDQGEQAPYDFFKQYRIAPGDVLDVLYQVRTWQEQEEFRISIDHVVSVKFVELPNLNETERVRPDGKISLPYLGEVYVVGMTIGELTAYLKEKYATILKSPELYVVVPEFQTAIKELKKDLHTAPRGLSRLVTVRPDGYATFAMLGDMLVIGKTIPEVAAELNKQYEEILPGLAADLFLEKHSGSRVYVLGEVGDPGAFPISKPTTVIEALALAGSSLPTANLSSLVVVRRKDDKMIGTRLNVNNTLAMKKDSSFFYLQPDDIVFVPRRELSKWADIAKEIAAITFFRGWGVSGSYELNSKGQ